ncbi:MAG: hypothetical protein HS116_03755 [Planctomycetes bacterium]|nr:hypothetical protein [Planctomycetota bacterium]
MKRTHHFVGLLLGLLAGALNAADPSPAASEPPPDAALLAQIEALPDNTWLKLPPCHTAGDMGVLNKDPDYKRIGPRVRDYCNKMVWAPERKRALYCGGGHNTHPFNDVWEFDLASNTWICLYGADPVPPRTKAGEEAAAEAWYKANAVLKDGVVRTPRGAPLRPCHTWWSLCYDSDLKRMLFLESHKGLFCVDKTQLAKALDLDPKDPLLRTYGSGAGEAWLFAFYPETREWKEVIANVPKARESSLLEYLPDSKTIWWASGKTYLYDAPKNEWNPVPLNGATGGGATAYDPETRKVVASVGLETWVFDCASGVWTKAQAEALDGVIVPHGAFCFDSAAKKFVLYTHLLVKDKLPGAPRLRLYDARTNQWTDPAPQGPAPAIGNIAGYYDPARNVTVIYSNKETWVYRCKKPTP